MRFHPAHHSRRRSGTRSGVTVIELMVTLATIGVLVGLLVPAVQSAREASRRLTCSANLHQIGIAVASYSEVYNSLPPSSMRKLRGFLFPESAVAADRNGFIVHAVLACPSDSVASTALGNQSYYYNDGASMDHYGNGVVGYRSGTRAKYIDISAIQDGLSTTAAASERLPLPRQVIRLETDYRTLVATMGRRLFHKTQQSRTIVDEFADECRYRYEEIPPLISFGQYYNHFLTPNVRDCYNGRMTHRKVVSAKSYHPGGVNVLMADGSTHFFSDHVSLEVWRAIATRDGNDVVNF